MTEKSPENIFARAGITGLRRLKLEASIRHLTRRSERETIDWRRGFQIGLLDAGLRVAGLRGRGEANTRAVRLRECAVALPDLPPAMSGFRVLHLSDLHFGSSFPAHAAAVYALLDGVRADLCVMTGDFRYGHFGPSNHVRGMVAHMLAGMRLRHGAYAVLGNHDTLMIGEALELADVRVLYNEGVPITHNGAVLWLGGVDDPHLYRRHDVEAAFRDAPKEAFRVLLAHSPELSREAVRQGVGLYLCGHTHGGQVCLPKVGPIHKNARCRWDQVAGFWREKGMVGYTSAGLGATDLPVRFNCPPEATMLVLQPECKSGVPQSI